jgi:flagellar biosynthesis protein FlhA
VSLNIEGTAPSPRSDIALGLTLVGVVGVMILPLPPFLLDILLSTSVAISLLVFLVALHLERPLEFSSFPSLLLVITLFRLAMNVATTRLILQHGADGPGAVGAVIHSFGQVMVGGSYVIGAVVFIILIIINFIVITKGAGRVAEVAARFTLDSMPGKQMAIDADLGAGLITEREARQRRRVVEQEADFYGAMDGASKFVRGDAVAGLLVTVINIVGGLIVGVLQKGLDIGTAARTFTVLTIGDGLVSQIPALLVSAAAGVVTTRAAAGSNLGGVFSEQLFGKRRALLLSGTILFFLGLVPRMPWVFILLGGGLMLLGRRVPRQSEAAQSSDGIHGPQAAAQPRREQPEDLLPIDLLSLEVGYELVPLVDAERDGSMLRRIATLRRQFAQDYGVVVPPIHVRDNLRLKPGEYRLLLLGNELGRGALRVRSMLAMTNTGDATGIPGEETREPAFNLPARWIAPEDAERAAMQGMTVVDPATVMATHLGEMLRVGAPELLGRREVEHLLENFAKSQPKIVEELVPAMLPLGDVAKVLRNLLREGISVRDLRTILEGLSDHAAQIKDPDVLTDLVRQRMARHITSKHRAEDGAVHGIILDARVEELFRPQPGRQGAGPDPRAVPRILGGVEAAVRDLQSSPYAPLLITAPDVRRAVAALVMRHVPGLQVISYREIEPSTPIKTIGVVTMKD